MIKLLIRICVLAGMFVIAGCSTYTQQPQDLPPVVNKPGVIEPNQPVILKPQPGSVPNAPAPAAPALNPAALSLAKQARQQYQALDYQGAIATAERGLRIERRSAELYLVLAQSYIQLALPEKAKMFVQQGLRFAPLGSDAEMGLLRVKGLLGD